jgi:hypothetical protein
MTVNIKVQGSIADFCEQGNNSLGCIKMGHSLTNLNDQTFKEIPTSWI